VRAGVPALPGGGDPQARSARADHRRSLRDGRPDRLHGQAPVCRHRRRSAHARGPARSGSACGGGGVAGGGDPQRDGAAGRRRAGGIAARRHLPDRALAGRAGRAGAGPAGRVAALRRAGRARLDAPVSSALAHAAERQRLRLVPGPRFGTGANLERYLRLPFTLPEADLLDAAHRLAAARASLDPARPVPLAAHAPVA